MEELDGETYPNPLPKEMCIRDRLDKEGLKDMIAHVVEKDKRKEVLDMPLLDFKLDRSESYGGGGSTDVGDVSWVVPTVQTNVCCYAAGTALHSWPVSYTHLFRLSSPLCPTWASVRAHSRPSYYSCLFPVTLSVTIFQTCLLYTSDKGNIERSIYLWEQIFVYSSRL